MKNQMMLLLAFLAVLMTTSSVLAAPPEGDTVATETGTSGDTGGTEDTGSTGADEAVATTDTGAETGTSGDTEADETVVAEAKIESDAEAVSMVESLVEAAKGGQWSLVAAIAMMLLVYVLNRFGLKDKLGDKAVPWVATGMSMLGYVAAALMVDGASISEALLGGLASGAAAVGLWEMLFKHLLSNKKGEATEAPA